jgi:hypothetical protein
MIHALASLCHMISLELLSLYSGKSHLFHADYSVFIFEFSSATRAASEMEDPGFDRVIMAHCFAQTRQIDVQ